MIWYRFGEWIIRRRFLVLLVIGAMTAFFGYFAAKTELVTSFGDLLPQNHPFIQIAHKYEQYFGATNTVTIMIEAKDGDVYQPNIVQKIVNMTRNMDLVYGIQHGSVRSLATASYFRPLAGGVILNSPILPNGKVPESPEDIAELRSNVHKNPGVVYGSYISLDDKAAVVTASFLESRLDYKRIFDDIRKIVVQPERDSDGEDLHRRSAHPLWLGVRVYAADLQNFPRHRARGLDAALPVLPRLARRAAADHLRRHLRDLGIGFHPHDRVHARSAGAGHPVPHNRARRQPFGADARSVLRRVLPAARQAEGDFVGVRGTVRAVVLRNPRRCVRGAGHPAGTGAVPAEARDHREFLDRRDYRQRAVAQSDRLLLPRAASYRGYRAARARNLQAHHQFDCRPRCCRRPGAS